MQAMWIYGCFVIGVTMSLASAQGFAPFGFMDQECLDCFCQASSSCDLNIGCNNVGPSQYYCGPFQISFSYWQDGGSPGSDPNDPLDFEICLNNRRCAEAAVRGYMTKWGRDCDNNGVVNCYDFARIHMAGPYGCNGTWVLTTDFWTRFKACYRF
uniref:lysozyme n=1 Tax=Liphistius sp. SGP-2016 TaxID=1905180 RepID=A0A4Q8K1W4_9ARAC